MTEIELKFQVDAGQRDAVARAVATRSAQRVRLTARYFDSADRRLANAQLALRVRREGHRWVQTLKGAGDGLWQRLEHEVILPAAAGAPPPLADIALHDGTAAGDALRAALGDAPLRVTYATQVTRTLRRVRAPGCVVELAFDEGALLADARRAPLRELEFELKSGDAGAMCVLAERWVKRFGLTLDVRSKSERGDRLARGMPCPSPAKAADSNLSRHIDSDAALRAIVGAALRQSLANASELLHGDGGAEHLHQLRVGLRRLRSALRDLSDGHQAFEAEWLPPLKRLFDSLGSARDRDALSQWLLPALRRAGAGDVQLPSAVHSGEVLAALRDPATTRLWLALLAFAASAGTSQTGFAVLAGRRLQHLHRRVRRDARRFGELDEAARHRLRKRVKRLRYLCEFAGSQFRRTRVKAYLGKLTPAQDALGHYQDVVVARNLFEAAASEDAQAHFALGWLAHERDMAEAACVRSLVVLRKAKPFW